MWSDKIHMKKIWYFLGKAIRSVWLRGIMGVDGGEGWEVNRSNHVKFFGSKVKEFFSFFLFWGHSAVKDLNTTQISRIGIQGGKLGGHFLENCIRCIWRKLSWDYWWESHSSLTWSWLMRTVPAYSWAFSKEKWTSSAPPSTFSLFRVNLWQPMCLLWVNFNEVVKKKRKHIIY